MVNSRFQSVLDHALALTKVKNEADEIARAQYRYDENSSPLPQRKGRERKRRKADNNAELFSETILVRNDDLKHRAMEPYECRIDRTAWFTNTRFYPYFMKLNANPDKFYLEKTELCCIWCTEPCNCVPVPIPHRYSIPLKQFWVSGQFCSFECMLAEARERNKLALAYHLMSEAYGIKKARTTYKPAPSRFVLEKFGGAMTYEAFRATSRRTDLILEEISIPFIPFTAGLQEVEKMEAKISEYGDEERTKDVIHSMTIRSRPQPLRASKKVQKSKFAMALTIKEQLEQSEQRMRLQMQEVENGGTNTKKKQRTLKDFMIKKKT